MRNPFLMSSVHLTSIVTDYKDEQLGDPCERLRECDISSHKFPEL